MARAPYILSLIPINPCLREDPSICSSWPRPSLLATCELFACSMTTRAGTLHGKEKAPKLETLEVIFFFYKLTFPTKRYISKIVVQDLQSRNVWHFFCNCWLSADRGDGTTKKTFNAAKTNEIASFRSEFFTLIKKKTKKTKHFSSFFTALYKRIITFLSGTSSKAERRLVSGTNTSGYPSWILPLGAPSHGLRGCPAACACSSAPWPSTSLSGTFLQMQAHLCSSH